MSTTQTTNQTVATSDAIAKSLTGYLNQLIKVFDQEITNSQNATNAANARNEFKIGAETNGRIPLLVKAADQALAQSWSTDDINDAVTEARGKPDRKNPQWRTRNVFLSELKQVIHPTVRRAFPLLVAATTAQWKIEEQLIEQAGPKDSDDYKAPKTPLHSFKPRLYRVIMDMARRTKSNAANTDNRGPNAKVVVTTPEQAIQYAILYDPTTLATSVASKCKVLAKAFQAMAQEFHYDKFTAIANYLNDSALAKEITKAREDWDENNRPVTNNLRAPNGQPKKPIPEAIQQAADEMANEPEEDDDYEDDQEDNEQEMGVVSTEAIINGLVAA